MAVERDKQGKIKGQATGQSHRKSATVGRRQQVGHIWVGQRAVTEVPLLTAYLETLEGRTVSRLGPSRKTPQLRFSGGRGFLCLSGLWGRREGWLQRDSCTCNADGCRRNTYGYLTL